MLETGIGRHSRHRKPVTGAAVHSQCRRALIGIGVHSDCRKPGTETVHHSYRNPVTVTERCSCHRSPDTGPEWRNFPDPGPLRDILHRCGQVEESEQAHRSEQDIPHN